MNRITALLLSTSLFVSACDGTNAEKKPDRGPETGGSPKEKPKPASPPQQTCLLDASLRSKAEKMVGAVVREARFIGEQSRGQGAGAERAFGSVIPFTTLASLATQKTAGACDGPKTFDAHCEKLGTSASSQCTQLTCVDAGVLSAHMWIDPLPMKVSAEPGPGETQVIRFDSNVEYEEAGPAGLIISWANDVSVAPPGAQEIYSQMIGMATVKDGADANISIVDKINGLGGDALVVTIKITGTAMFGEATIAQTKLASIDERGMHWTEECGQ